MVASVELHASEYQGTWPFSVALLMLRVHRLLVYPSQLQLSSSRPPLPEAQTKMEPLPPRPWGWGRGFVCLFVRVLGRVDRWGGETVRKTKMEPPVSACGLVVEVGRRSQRMHNILASCRISNYRISYRNQLAASSYRISNDQQLQETRSTRMQF